MKTSPCHCKFYVVTRCNVKISFIAHYVPLFAGLTYTLKPTKTGFELTAKGYNEKMPKFLLTIVDAIYALDLSEGWTKSYILTDCISPS